MAIAQSARGVGSAAVAMPMSALVALTIGFTVRMVRTAASPS
jgi:hypothetical protein